MMKLKQKIGSRITETRKALGITIKELAARTGTLSAGRISNWEQGTRSPGPEEAKQLGAVLNVSASYLLGISDVLEGELLLSADSPQKIPLFSCREIMLDIPSMPYEKTVAVDGRKALLPENLFAVQVEDTSMEPDFKLGDVVILCSDVLPIPGD